MGTRRRQIGTAVFLVLWAAALLGGILAPTATAANGDLTLSITSLDMAAYPSVSAGVQLGGPLASTLPTLTAEAFSAQVDGSPVTVTAAAEAGTAALPVQTVLLIDESGSMKGEAIASAAQAAGSFITMMRPGDTAAVQAFNTDFRTLQTFTDDQTALTAALEGLQPRKETALYDALLKSYASFGAASTETPQYLILLSDGGDTVSLATLDEVLARTRASGVQVYAIGLKTEEFDSQPLVNIAEASGGGIWRRRTRRPSPLSSRPLRERSTTSTC